MAKKLGTTAKNGAANGAVPKAGEAVGSTAGHNAAARGDLLRRGFAKLWGLDREIKSTIEQEVAPLREERSEAWKTLRNDLDMKAADIKPLYDLYKRDQEVRALDDEEEMRKSQDAIREAYDNLREGETLNFLGVVGGGGKPATRSEATTDPDRSAELEEQGRTAHKSGGTRGMCPWPEESESGKAWLRGFDAAVAATAAAMDPDSGTTQPDKRKKGQPPRNKAEKAGEVAAGHA